MCLGTAGSSDRQLDYQLAGTVAPVYSGNQSDCCNGACVCVRAESCLTLCDPMDCSPPGSFVDGIHLLRMLEWVAISSSRASSQPRDRTHITDIQYGAPAVCQTLDLVLYMI